MTCSVIDGRLYPTPDMVKETSCVMPSGEAWAAAEGEAQI
jgi:hypothetical protein